MSIELGLFAVVAGVAAASSLMVVLRRSPLRQALWLVVSLISTAVIFVLLHGHFIGFIQILLYTGAIMVLFIFVIMLINPDEDESEIARSGKSIAWTRVAEPAAVVALLLLCIFIAATVSLPTPSPMPPAGFGSTRSVATSLLFEYFWIFEITSVLLLVAIVGAVVVTRYERLSASGSRDATRTEDMR